MIVLDLNKLKNSLALHGRAPFLKIWERDFPAAQM